MADAPAPPMLVNAPLGPRLTMGTGGSARYLVVAEDEDTLRRALRWANARALPVLILGGGSNVICADEGIDGLVIQVALAGVETTVTGEHVEVCAAAGEDWDGLVAHTVERGLAGLECLSGIPGLVGSTPIQNVGAYGQDVSETISEVRCLDRSTLTVTEFDNPGCEFSYRTSRFKGRDLDRYVVLSVRFRLRSQGKPKVAYADLVSRVGPEPSLSDVRHAVLQARREKSMLLDPEDPNHRSCGSFFLNPILPRSELERVCRTLPGETPPHYVESDGRVKLAAAWLIERAGFSKGQRSGNVGLSTRHALCVVAHAGATASEVLAFARTVKDGVQRRFGIALEAEPRFYGLPPP